MPPIFFALCHTVKHGLHKVAQGTKTSRGSPAPEQDFPGSPLGPNPIIKCHERAALQISWQTFESLEAISATTKLLRQVGSSKMHSAGHGESPLKIDPFHVLVSELPSRLEE